MAKHDHVVLHMEMMGSQRFFLEESKNIDFGWPPPEFIIFDGQKMREATENDERVHVFQRRRMSELTDEQIAGCDGIARGAEYFYVEPPFETGPDH